MRADCWERLGQWRLAVTDYRALLARCPDFAVAANSLAWCPVSVVGRGNSDEAVRWARKAVDLAPSDPDHRNTLGAAFYRDGRFAEAAIESQPTLRVFSHYPRLLYPVRGGATAELLF